MDENNIKNTQDIQQVETNIEPTTYENNNSNSINNLDNNNTKTETLPLPDLDNNNDNINPNNTIEDTHVPIHEINDNNTINKDIKKWEEGHKKPREKTVIQNNNIIEFMNNHGVKADNSPFVNVLIKESKKKII